MFKTVREVVLEHEVAELKRELQRLQAVVDSEKRSFLYTESLDCVTVTSKNVELQGIVRWTISDEKDDSVIKVLGVAFPTREHPGLSHTYYVSKAQLYGIQDRVTLLGALHERVIKALADIYPD